jgi:predicted ArsR family transcriptional regulator
MTDDFARQVSGVGALTEPARRALYLYVVAQPDAVSRDQAAAGVDLPRHTAKFHLDRLVEEGLLETEFRRLSGRQGPGAGRPSKLYRRAERQVEVTLPERHYELAGAILAAAVEAAADGDPVMDAVARTARAAGRRMAASTTGLARQAEARQAEARQADVQGPGPDADLDALAEVLGRYGYEPRREGDRLVLANCPFHTLARDHTQLVCSMNLEVIGALADELQAGDESARSRRAAEVRLDPEPGRCCVTLSLPRG